MNYVELSKEISYALRHAPQEYGLNPDEEGWVNVNQLISSLGRKKEFQNISEKDIISMIHASQKKRHECLNGKIRALYGHTLNQKIIKEVMIPPEILFHGTAGRFVEDIMHQGLLSQKRQYVHLSEDLETAITVGKRHDKVPVILKINSASAHNNGIIFFRGGEQIWLSESIPSQYIEIYDLS